MSYMDVYGFIYKSRIRLWVLYDFSRSYTDICVCSRYAWFYTIYSYGLRIVAEEQTKANGNRVLLLWMIVK